MTEVFGRAWLLVGLECELPEVGSYMAITIGRTPVLLVRGPDNRLRGFFNSCRHRGMPLVEDGCGKATGFSCPYHQWRYDQVGRLLRTPRMKQGIVKAEYPLVPVHVETVAGTIYVSLAHSPPDFGPFRRGLEPMLREHHLEGAKLAAEVVLREKANWKLVMENARECYHCAANHPELTKSFPVNRDGEFAVAGMSDMQDFLHEMESLGLPSKASAGNWWQVSRFPLGADAISISRDGAHCVKKPMCPINGGDIGSLRWTLEPHAFASAVGDYLFLFSALPTGPEETTVVAKWYVSSEAEESTDYQRDALMHVWHETNLQDQRLVERNQRGVNSLGYTPGPFNQGNEILALRFTDWYVSEVKSFVEQATTGKGSGSRLGAQSSNQPNSPSTH